MIHVFTDGASKGNPGDAGIGIVIFQDDKKIDEISEYIGKKTNNEAEYFGIIRALRYLQKKKIKEANIFLDSEFVVKQVNSVYKIKSEHLKKLYSEVQRLRDKGDFKVSWIPRTENKSADTLANLGITDYFKSRKRENRKSKNDFNVESVNTYLLKDTENRLLIEHSFFGKINCLKFRGLSNGLFLELGLKKENKWNWKKVKLNLVELGDILSLLKTEKVTLSLFHKYNNKKTIIYINKSRDRLNFRIEEFSKNLTPGESEILRILIVKYIELILQR